MEKQPHSMELSRNTRELFECEVLGHKYYSGHMLQGVPRLLPSRLVSVGVLGSAFVVGKQEVEGAGIAQKNNSQLEESIHLI
jgi:hypothetical protein